MTKGYRDGKETFHVDYDGFHIDTGGLLRRSYEFCFEGSTRGPDEYPYSFDAYWLWHDDLEKRVEENWSADYADRFILWEGFSEKYKEACTIINKDFKSSWTQWRKPQCEIVIEKLYGDKYEACGLSRSCNVSNGYDIAMFWYRPKLEIKT